MKTKSIKKQRLYYIRIQRYSTSKRWMEIMAWPKVFKSYAEADKFMRCCFTFKGLGNRKLSASIERCR